MVGCAQNIPEISGLIYRPGKLRQIPTFVGEHLSRIEVISSMLFTLKMALQAASVGFLFAHLLKFFCEFFLISEHGIIRFPSIHVCVVFHVENLP
jgi:hypothetical protein